MTSFSVLKVPNCMPKIRYKKSVFFLEKQVTDGHNERAKQTCSDGQ